MLYRAKREIIQNYLNTNCVKKTAPGTVPVSNEGYNKTKQDNSHVNSMFEIKYMTHDI